MQVQILARFSLRTAADRLLSAASGSAPYLPIWC